MAAVKVIRFLDGDTVEPGALQDRWTRALSRRDAGGPYRVAVATPVEAEDLPESPFAAVDLQWFADAEAALAHESWLQSVDPELCVGSWQIVAEELVLRGHDYLRARWEAGGRRYKMMSFGRRNPSLTPEEFSARWRGHAGQLGSERIPDEVRGLAYIQNHPLRVEGRTGPLDAVNEVYVEQLDHLRRRHAYLAARQQSADDLMSRTETWSMCVEESLVPSARPRPTPSRRRADRP
jgi:hypothetical protein